MTNRFNILGFSMPSSKLHPTKLCPIHHAVLVPKRNDTTGEYETGMLRCPLCGSTYSEKQAFTTITTNEEGVNSQ
jgi:hypothetical protein